MRNLSYIGRPVDHPGRLEALAETHLLDSVPEEAYDRFTRLTTVLLGAEISLVSLISHDRQFFKSEYGLSEPFKTERQTHISSSFCRFVVETGQPFIVDDALQDKRVDTNPAVAKLGVIAYLGVPLATREGDVLGSLCAIESHPRKWSEMDLENLADLAGAVMREIEHADHTSALKQALSGSELHRAEREQDVLTISHDLRTPAGAISTCLDMLAQEADHFTKEHLELLEISKESTEHLLDMIQHLLESDQLRARGSALKIQPVSASLLLRRASRVVRPFADDAGITLDVEFPSELILLQVDGGMIERCLLNMLTNAVKYSPSGGSIRLRIERTEEEGTPMCRITVTDQGPGVPDRDKARIFEQFVTGSAPSERGMKSFGIGLSFCKSVIESHGGRIGVEDAPGGGSRFFCLLPV